MHCLLFLVLFSLTLCGAEDCTKEHKIGHICTLHVTELMPTQFAVGEGEVACKKGQIESKSKKKLREWLADKSRRIPTIIGPEGKFYMLDKHHTARALFEANVDDDLKVMTCEIKYSWVDSEEVFWEKMVTNNLLWLYDQKGLFPMTPEVIPTSISLLLDDPYRTLAWLVRSKGGYGKVAAHFAEFQWANFFRQKIPLSRFQDTFVGSGTAVPWCEVNPYARDCLPDQARVLQEVLPIAMKWAESSEAKDLPGYGQGEIDPPNCGKQTVTEYYNITDQLLK